MQIGLAVSLHQTTDEKRDALMPVNKRYPISGISTPVRSYYQSSLVYPLISTLLYLPSHIYPLISTLNLIFFIIYRTDRCVSILRGHDQPSHHLRMGTHPQPNRHPRYIYTSSTSLVTYIIYPYCNPDTTPDTALTLIRS